jgi:meso-butanediol dehydrogenase/(S,S)-butanediol dehydrogenase/diacetyl reductase
MGDLDGRVAVVTGGARGIGLECARCMSEQGALLVIADIDHDEAVKGAESLPGRAVAFEHDVTDAAASVKLAQFTAETFGQVDILVNNAGINVQASATVDVPEEVFDRIMNVNVKGMFLVTKAFLPALIERQHQGRIINMSSIVGHKGVPLVLPYSASKFAVVGMSQSLAGELASTGVTVNTVHPGIVDTSLHDTVTSGWAAIRNESFEETWEWFRSQVPQGEYQTARDIAEVVAFLASDRAKHITGSAIDIDGGILMR